MASCVFGAIPDSEFAIGGITLVHRRTMYNLFTENRHTFRIKYPMLRADTVIAMPTGHRFTSFLMPIPMSWPVSFQRPITAWLTVSKTWPHIVLTYKGMSLIKSARMGTLRYSLFDSDPEIFSSEIDPKNIPAKRMTQAAKAFADAKRLMSNLKKCNPALPPWREHEEPGDCW